MIQNLEGLEKTPQRAALHALNLDTTKPLIGIVSAESEFVLAHKNAHALAQLAKEGILSCGGQAVILPVASICSNGSVGTEGAKYVLPFRDLTADTVEALTGAQYFDGLLFVANQPSVLAGMLLGALRINIPCLFVLPGPMPPKTRNGTNSGYDKMLQSVGQVKTGKISADLLSKMESEAGTCYGTNCDNYSDNAMNFFLEAVGLTLRDASVTEPGIEQNRIAFESGKTIVRMTASKLTPRRILTKSAFEAGIKADFAMGSSSLSLLNFEAIATELGTPFGYKQITQLARSIPQIAEISTAKNRTVRDFAMAGGVYGLLKRLAEDGALSTDYLIYNEKTMQNALQDVLVSEDIRPMDSPLYRDGICVLTGNLAEEGCICFSKEKRAFLGTARTFDTDADATEALLNRQIAKGTVVVVRNSGKKSAPGMPQVSQLISVLNGMEMTNDVAVVTDGRISNQTDGIVVGHILPETADGGLLAYVQDGDMIEINLSKGKLTLDVPARDLKKRKKTVNLTVSDSNAFLKKYQKSSLGK